MRRFTRFGIIHIREPFIPTAGGDKCAAAGSNFNYQGQDKWISSTKTKSAIGIGAADVDGDKRADLLLRYVGVR